MVASMLILHSLISSAGEQYIPVSTNVTFNASTSTHTVNIPILDNEIVAGSTMFSVFLTSADPAVILNPATADITIEDDDSEKLCMCACSFIPRPVRRRKFFLINGLDTRLVCMWESIACK